MASFAEWTEQEKKKKKKQSAEGVSFTEYTKQVLGRDDIEAPLSERKEEEDIAPVKNSGGGGDFGGSGSSRSFGEGEKGDFWDWLGDSAMSGLAAFNKGITSTVDVILGKPLQALGWEHNPISSVANHYDRSYDYYKEQAKESTSKMGGGGYGVASEIVEGTVSALPDALMALVTMGTSYAPSAVNLATQAMYRTSGLLTKAGLTVSSMAKNPQFWLSFTRTYGNDYEEAINSGADETTAAFTSTLTSLINAGIEIGVDGGSGFQGLPDKIKGGDKSAIRAWVESALEEGGEEVLQGFVNDAVAKVSYDPNREMLNPKEMATEFGMGAAVGGILGGGQIAVQSGINAGVNAVQKAEASKLTETEQKIVDKVYEDRVAEAEENGKLTQKEKSKIYDTVLNDMEKGYISTDTIESVLGGETYKTYKDTIDSEDALQNEFNTLNKMKQGEMTGEQIDRRAELKQQLEELKNNSQRDQLKQQLSDEVFNLAKDSRLIESYNERARRGTAFEADLSKYDAKQQAVVQKAVESGILNNTNRTHEFVDMVAKISADKGVLFDFTNNAKLKESGFAVDGKTVNGYVTKDGITVNMDSNKYVNSVVGHEITHVLEGTELYTELQSAVMAYAKSKNDYQGRYDALTELYKDIDGADIDAELTADLVGDYLFTDSDFINRLSTENRNVFQKIYDEIKYLYKVATAGSKEARELEKVKRVFDKAYKESGKAQGGTKYSLGETTNGRFVAIVDSDILSNIDTSTWDKTKKDEARKAASDALKQFSDGIVVDGITRKVNRTSRREYTRSEYTEKLYNRSPDVFADKMRAAEVADDIVVATTNWKRDGGLSHPRNDNFVDFDHGTTLILSDSAKYSAEVVVGITDAGEAVLYDVVDLIPTTFDIKKEESPTTATTQNAIGDIQGDSFEDIIPQNSEKSSGNTKYSLTADSDGKQLTAEQQEYFKDSKMRDENGNLKVMYHGSQDAGFHTFDSNMSDDDTSFFFVDRNDVAASYSGTTETYEAKTIRTAEDMNNFLSEIGYDNYEAVERDGKFELLENGEHVAYSDTAKGIYEEFCWYEGVGEGDANYKVYLNLKNPLVVDAKGRPWNKIDAEFSQEVYDRYQSLTAEEKAALVDLAEWEDFRLFNSEIQEAKGNELASAYAKMGDNVNIYDLFSVAADNFSEESMRENARKYLNTREFAQRAHAQGYDGVIFNNIIDNGGYSNGSEGASTVAIAFESNQIKSVANEKPTANADIRFSLSKSVEETKDLVAVHNLSEEKLVKSLNLGGLPMPSIAIARAKEGHNSFGNISLVFNKETIDPQFMRSNKVYSGDAWTPTYPRVEHKVSDKAQEKIEDRINNLVPEEVLRELGGLHIDSYNLEQDLNRYNGNLVEVFRNNTALKYAFLTENGAKPELPIKNKPLGRYSNRDDDAIIRVAETVPEEKLRGILHEYTNEQIYEVEPEIRKAVNGYLQEKYKNLPEKAKAKTISEDTLPIGRIYDYAQDALNYLKNGLEQEVDYYTARTMIDETIDAQKYEAWVKELFANIVEKEGIRNNKDLFTPSGNRRGFEALHYEHNLENVIKAMKEDGEKGVGTFGRGNIFGASTTEYGSIAEIKEDAQNRMKQMPEDEYEKIRKGFSDRFFELAYSLPIHKDSYTATDSAANMLIEAVVKFKTKSGMANYIRKESQGWANYSDYVVDDLIELVNDIRTMPVDYFEAKPQRAVGFDEVATAIIPDKASDELKQMLTDKGIAYVEYESGNEQARLEVLNSLEDAKFSLSEQGEHPTKFGNYHVKGKDLLLEQEIAPVAETVAETVDENAVPDGFAPITEEEAEALREESFESLDDAEAPPEVDMPYDSLVDTITIDNKSLKQLSKNISDSLGLNRAGKQELERVLQDFSKDEYGTKEKLYAEIERRFGTQYEAMRNNEVAGAKEYIRNTKINVSPTVKSEFGETKDYVNFMRSNFGKIRFSKDGMGVDEIYAELTEMYPALFSDDAINPADQLRRIAEVANTPISELIPTRLPQDVLQDATDMIYDSISEYKETERMIATADMQNVANEHIEDFAPIGDDVESVPTAKGTEAPTAKEAVKQPVEEKKSRRQELHDSILEGVKSRFEEKGFDFDKVLAEAKDLSTLATVDNTPQRVMEKALGYKEGQILSDITVNQVAQNETEGIKWLNSFTDRKSGFLAQISKQYGIKAGSKESAAAQMYAEGFYVAENGDIVKYGDAELAADFPDANVRFNIKSLANDPRIRQIYDDTLAMINESRSRNAYPEIPRLDNYFLHFRAMEDTFSRLGLPFNPNDIRAKDLPTDLNGVTADLKPGQPYFASAMHRTGKRTSFDLLGGLERYLTSAKNQIYHIDDIQTLRALRNYIADTYGQAKGLENLDALSEEEVQERIEKVYGAHLSTFAKFLNEEANVLAGKTALIDRGLEGIIGRRGITFIDTLNKQVGSNMVGFNVSSSLTNFIPVAQTFAKTNKFDFVKAFAQTVSNKIGSIFGRTDGFAENSPVIIRRKGADRFYRTPFQKVGDAGYVLMGAVDDISTELIARTKYNELTRKGMDSQQAHFETDKWVSRLMGDRSLGQQPQMYNSKMLGLFTKFQLEVRNQLDSQFYDTIQEAKVSNEDIQNGLARNAKTAAKVASTFAQLAIVQHLFGKAFESVAGYNPAFDIIGVLIKALGFDDDEESEDTALDNIEQGFLELLEDLPYTSTFTGGGRIPISAALPIEEFVTGVDEYGNEKSRWDTLGEVAPYYVLPTGYGQIKKTKQGLSMFDDDLPIAGSYTDSGNLRFPVDDTVANKIQAGVFGQWSNENARDYFDNELAPLKEKQIQEFIELDMPIKDYREIREDLSEFDKLADKADYINSLDLPISKKNILINNIADRKEPINMEDYKEYGDFEEFDFAEKNPEKYTFFKENGISYKEYASADEDGKRAYTWAFENPEKYTVSKAICDDFQTYYRYKSELYDIKADKDKNGDTIVGTGKEKKIEYINNLDLEYGQKIILLRSLYDSKEDKANYNADIVDYLNSRDDISYEEMETILTELGFTVSADGTISW